MRKSQRGSTCLNPLPEPARGSPDVFRGTWVAEGTLQGCDGTIFRDKLCGYTTSPLGLSGSLDTCGCAFLFVCKTARCMPRLEAAGCIEGKRREKRESKDRERGREREREGERGREREREGERGRGRKNKLSSFYLTCLLPFPQRAWDGLGRAMNFLAAGQG